MEPQGDLAKLARKLRSPVPPLPQQVEAAATLKDIMAEPPETKKRTIALGAEPAKKKIRLVKRTTGASPIR